MKNTNAVRERLDDDEYVIGLKSTTRSKAVIEICGELGLDYVWLDFEHIGESPHSGTDVVEDYVRTAENAGVELFARIPSGDPALIRKLCDTGLKNMVVPKLESAAEVREAIRTARFHYDGGAGNRGYGTARMTRWGDPTEDFVEAEDHAVNVGMIVEQKEVMDDLDAVISVPELAYVWIGSIDFSISLGHPFQTDREEQLEYERQIKEKCREYDVPMGITLHNREEAREAMDGGLEEGYQLLNIGEDHDIIRSTLRERAEIMRSDHFE